MGQKNRILSEKELVGRNRKRYAFSFVHGYWQQYQYFADRFLVNVLYIAGFTKSTFNK